MPALTASPGSLEESVRANNLKEVAALASGRFILHRAPVPLENVVREFLAMFRGLHASSGVRLSFRGSGSHCMVLGDTNRLLEVLDNLLTNALQHTPPGGTIEVSTYESDAEVGVSVIDEGAGIAAADRAHLFKKTPRGGLGLYVSKTIVEGHSGKIGMRQEVLRKGSIFFFSLPKLSAAQLNWSPPTAAPSALRPLAALSRSPAHSAMLAFWFLGIHIALWIGISQVKVRPSAQWVSRTGPDAQNPRDGMISYP